MAKYFVWWTDFVANEWVEVVEGAYESDTEQRLRDLAKAGADAGDFGMNVQPFFDDRILATLTVEQFFDDLDWDRWVGP